MVTSSYKIQDVSIFGDLNEEICLELHRTDEINDTKYSSDVACFIDRNEVEVWLKENPFRIRLEQQKVVAPYQFPLIARQGTYIEPRSFEDWLEMVGKAERDEDVAQFIESHKRRISESTQWQFNKLNKRVQFEPFKRLAA